MESRSLSPSLTLQQLCEPHGSFPANPLLAEPLYLDKFIERMGTGTRDMIRLCREAGLPEPQFAIRDGFVSVIQRPNPQAATQVTTRVAKVLQVATNPTTREELQEAMCLKNREHFRQTYLEPLIELNTTLAA